MMPSGKIAAVTDSGFTLLPVLPVAGNFANGSIEANRRLRMLWNATTEVYLLVRISFVRLLMRGSLMQVLICGGVAFLARYQTKVNG